MRVPAVTGLCLRLALKGELAEAVEGLWELGGLGHRVGARLGPEDLWRTKLVTASTLLAAMDPSSFFVMSDEALAVVPEEGEVWVGQVGQGDHGGVGDRDREGQEEGGEKKGGRGGQGEALWDDKEGSSATSYPSVMNSWSLVSFLSLSHLLSLTPYT